MIQGIYIIIDTMIHCIFFYFTGFMQKEIEKAEIPIGEMSENPDAPHPREMIDLEVSVF